MNIQQQNEIARFLSSGEHDNAFSMWSGSTFLDSANIGDSALRRALIADVKSRSANVAALASHLLVPKINARLKFTPMVHGLFPIDERQTVLELLNHSVIFLTPESIQAVLESTPRLRNAWKLANLYLDSLDAKPLDDTGLGIVGLSVDKFCYVSMRYVVTPHLFDDYVIHEAAHIFHNCKRESIGLPATRRREWMLDIDYTKRETFAYSCEAYSRILELAINRSERIELLSKLVAGAMPPDDRVDEQEYVDILQEAVAARNGWKRILERCSPPRCP